MAAILQTTFWNASFLMEEVWISIKNSLKFGSEHQLEKKLALVQLTQDKMAANFLTTIANAFSWTKKYIYFDQGFTEACS